MSDLFKLTFTPIVGSKESINKYRVDVEYFDKSIALTKFDMRNEKKLGFVVYFTNYSIEVTKYYLEGYNGESYTVKSLLDDNYLIEKKNIQLYIDSIEYIKPQLEKLCMEKQKEEELRQEAWNDWLQEKPIEFTF